MPIKTLSRSLLILLWLGLAMGLKVFLLGGAVTKEQPDVYVAMGRATGRIAQPQACVGDWDTTTCPRVAVITSAAQNQAEGDDYYNVDEQDVLCFKNLFNLFGFSPKHVSVHVDNYRSATDLSLPEGQQNMQMLLKADIIFFDGGDQIRHSRCWLNDDGSPIPMFRAILDRAMSDRVILAGTSAGSMIMSSPAYGGGSSFGHLYFAASAGLAPKQIRDGAVGGTGLDDVRNGTQGLQYDYNGGMFTGFGLVPFLVDTHFDVRGRLARIIPGAIQTKNSIAIGLDEPSCLYYENGVGTVYGKQGVFVVDITKAYKSNKQFFNVNNVVVSYLSVGDAYDFKNYAVVVGKGKNYISSPQFLTSLDSNNIIKSYECMKVMTHLVDQIPPYNIGRTKTPQQFPSSTPTFVMGFARNSSTRGYRDPSGSLYTVVGAVVSITYQ